MHRENNRRLIVALLLALLACAQPASALSAVPVGFSDSIAQAVKMLGELRDRLDLPQLHFTGTISGKVVDARGKPVEGAKVSFPELPVTPLRTDEFGAFEAQLPAGGRWMALIQALGYQDLRQPVNVLAVVPMPEQFTMQTVESFLSVVLEHRGLNNLRGPFTSCLQALMQRPQGERYIRMFQEHSQELITIYINHPQLWEPTGALLQRLAQPASTLSRADTASMETGPLLGAATLDVLLEVLDSYAALAGRDLAADLDRLAAALTDFNGLTAEQVLERLGPRFSGVSTARRLLSARPQTTR